MQPFQKFPAIKASVFFFVLFAAMGCTRHTSTNESILSGPVPAPLTAGVPDPSAHQVGYNRFDLALQYQGTASGCDGGSACQRVDRAMARKSIWDAKNAGATFLRVSVVGFGPITWADQNDLWFWHNNPDQWFAAMDQMMDDLDAAGMRIVPNLAWNQTQYAALSGADTVHDWMTNPNSASWGLTVSYVTQFINRYASRQTILFYELTNELNLQTEEPNAEHCTATFAGQCDTVADFSTQDLIKFMARFGTLVKGLDPSRSISSGFGFPRQNSQNMRNKKGGNDHPPDYQQYLTDTHPDPIDIVSVHVYGGHNDPADPANQGSMTDLTRFYQEGEYHNWAKSNPGKTSADFMLSLTQFTAGNALKQWSGPKKLYYGETGYDTTTGSNSQRDQFTGWLASDTLAYGTQYISPWILEFYQGARDAAAPFNIEPGYTDTILSDYASLAQNLGTFVSPSGDDTVPPEVVVTTPMQGDSLNSSQELYAVASDDRPGPVSVTFSVDGQAAGTFTQPPFTTTIDTTSLPSGNHVIQAMATDAAGNSSTYLTQASGGGGPNVPLAWVVNSANYVAGGAAEEIVTVQGTGFADGTQQASSYPTLAMQGASIVIDGTVVPLFYVSPTQINFQLPAGLTSGSVVEVSVLRDGALVGSSNLAISAASPGVYTVDDSGSGLPWGQFLSGASTPVLLEDSTGAPLPIAISSSAAQTIVLYGTGWRGASPSDLTATIDGIPMTIIYSGKSADPGEDQMNLSVPASLSGSPARSVPLMLSYRGTVFAQLSVTITH